MFSWKFFETFKNTYFVVYRAKDAFEFFSEHLFRRHVQASLDPLLYLDREVFRLLHSHSELATHKI